VNTRTRYLGLAACGSLFLLLVFPVTAWGQPPSNHISVKLSITPDRPAVGEDSRLTIGITDVRQQPVASIAVAVLAEKASEPGAGGHAGMDHGGAQPGGRAFRGTVKASDNRGEYLATLRFPEDGQWNVMVTAGDNIAHLEVNVARAVAPASNTTGLAAGSALQGTSAAVSAPMESIHSSYLDLSANIADLRTRVGEWQQGNEDSLKIAEEKLERTEVVLGAVTWPVEMSAAIGKARAAVGPMATALKAKDLAAADTAAKALGDASHDITHAFYPDWLPALKGTAFSVMAPHAIYLDLNANISDLGSRLAAWQKGDEGSLNIAKEKVERIDLLLPHLSSTGMSPRVAQAIGTDLPAVTEALEAKDPASAKLALMPVASSSAYMTRDLYSWLAVTAGASDDACIQASYLDLSANIAGLRTQIGDWQRGNLDSVKTAQETLERTRTVLFHPEWPGEMATAVSKTSLAIEQVANALRIRDSAAADIAAKALGDASHDITHAYYGDWLPGARLDEAGNLVAAAQANVGSGSGGSHGHGSEPSLPNYWFVGSIAAIVVVTIVLVPILRRRDLEAQRVESG